jgi:hypothetical protein
VSPHDEPGLHEKGALLVENNSVTPAFFATLGLTVLRGRGFREDDGPWCSARTDRSR